MNPTLLKTKLLGAITLGALFLPVFSVNAEENMPPKPPHPPFSLEREHISTTAPSTARPVVKKEVMNDTKNLRTEEKASTSPKDIRDRIDNTTSTRKDTREDGQEKIKNERLLLIKNETHKVVDRFNAALQRLTTLSGRIDSRIKKFEADGSDMTASKQKLTDANAKITIAQINVDAIGALASTTLPTATSTKSFNPLRDAVNAARKSIDEAQKALTDVVHVMKPAADLFEKHATSTLRKEQKEENN